MKKIIILLASIMISAGAMAKGFEPTRVYAPVVVSSAHNGVHVVNGARPHNQHVRNKHHRHHKNYVYRNGQWVKKPQYVNHHHRQHNINHNPVR